MIPVIPEVQVQATGTITKPTGELVEFVIDFVVDDVEENHGDTLDCS